MRRVYLIDLENVQSAGLDGIDQLTGEDSIFIFYSDKADNLKVDLVKKILESPARVDFVKANNGTPNALDFQLISYLFYHVEADTQYWIVSKDTGYDAAIKMGKRMGLLNVRRAPAIKNAVHYGMRATKIAAYRAAKDAEREAEDELQEAEEEAAAVETDLEREEAEGVSVSSEEVHTEEEQGERPEENGSKNVNAEAEEGENRDAKAETEEADDAENLTEEMAEDKSSLKDASVTAIETESETAEKENRSEAVEAVTSASKEMQDTEEKGTEEESGEEQSAKMIRFYTPASQGTEKKKRSRRNTRNHKTRENHAPAAGTQEEQADHSNVEAAAEKEQNEVKEPVPFRAALSEILGQECNVATDPETLNLVEDGLRRCSNKGQFYQFFRRRMGAARGSAFYKSLRGQFDAMKKLMAE